MGQKSTDSEAVSTGFGSGSSAKKRAKEDEAERDKGTIASKYEKRMNEQHEILEGKKDITGGNKEIQRKGLQSAVGSRGT